MQSIHVRHIVLSALAAVALVFVVAPAAMAEQVAPAAQLSVTLISSADTVTAGDSVEYTGEVKNLADAEAVVTVVVETPAFLTLGAAEGATTEGNKASWPVTLAPGAAQAFSVEATVGEIPETEKRVTTLASVFVGDDTTPIVRTASASFIEGIDDSPAGDATTGQAKSSESGDASALPWAIGGIIAVLIVAAAVVYLVFFRPWKNRANRANHD